jgi:23S rRNA C2498 (ribose-2'-O)-methylase RlmM
LRSVQWRSRPKGDVTAVDFEIELGAPPSGWAYVLVFVRTRVGRW